jgi:hypothetical protein
MFGSPKLTHWNHPDLNEFMADGRSLKECLLVVPDDTIHRAMIPSVLTTVHGDLKVKYSPEMKHRVLLHQYGKENVVSMRVIDRELEDE